MSVLETDRLILRPWREEDAADLYHYAKDPRVGPAAGWAVHKDEADSLHILRTVLMNDENANNEVTWAVTIKGSDQPVGSIGVFPSEVSLGKGEPEIGYWIGVPFWGQGYIPEAVHFLLRRCFEKGAERVWCSHFEGNEKSRRVIEKSGFQYRCTQDWDVPAFNEVRKALYYSVSREDWSE
ncbi:MAG: GNAT family N-acetyltransferase [Clostridiales bacterium]|nr:GNAT family N-acetyltransferase [Clostridiales bacterium]